MLLRLEKPHMAVSWVGLKREVRVLPNSITGHGRTKWGKIKFGKVRKALENGANHSAIRADGSAICGRSKRTGEIHDHVGDFVGGGEALQKR
jgi:hypothetical protein